MKKVAIIGMGVVGKGMARLLESRFDIIPYDIGGDKEDVNTCDLGIVCVPTPSSPDGSCDLTAIHEVLSWLDTPLILIKSTIPPGTTRKLREQYGKHINFSPEYMGESSYFTPFWKFPDPQRAETHTFVIVGGDESSEILDYFQEVMSVDTHYMPVSAEEAELVKYMENTFFATKLAFCNDWYEIARLYGVDYKKLRELWLLDSRINPNHTIMKPVRGFGGKCLPKDLSAIIKEAESRGFTPEILKAARTWVK